MFEQDFIVYGGFIVWAPVSSPLPAGTRAICLSMNVVVCVLCIYYFWGGSAGNLQDIFHVFTLAHTQRLISWQLLDKDPPPITSQKPTPWFQIAQRMEDDRLDIPARHYPVACWVLLSSGWFIMREWVLEQSIPTPPWCSHWKYKADKGGGSPKPNKWNNIIINTVGNLKTFSVINLHWITGYSFQSLLSPEGILWELSSFP